jgi:hypothetical protein
MTEPFLGVGHPTPAGDTGLTQIRTDIARLVVALESLVTELAGVKAHLARMEGTINEIALGLGVRPK